jgi:TP901 family phage tail tape measure protein
VAENTLNLALVLKAYGASVVAQQVNQVVGAVSRLGNRVNGVMRGLALGGGGALGERFVENSVKGAAAFNGLMAHIQTASGATAAQVAKDGEAINAMAANGVIANTDLAAGVYNLISAGESEAQALQGVAIATRMVQATAKDATDAQATFAEGSRLLGDTMNVWGSRAAAAAPQLRAFADTFTQLQTKYSFASLGEVIEAVKIAGPSAHAAGVSFNEMNASIAMLSERGIHAAEAGTAAREVFSKLAIGKQLAGFRVIDPRTAGLDIVKTLEHIRAVLPPAGEMRNLMLSRLGFDIRDLPSVNLLIENAREMTGIVGDLNNSQGVAAAKEAVRMNAADMQLGLLANRWAVLKDKLGEALLPALMKVLGILQPVVKWMLALAGAHSGITALAMGVVALGSAAIVAGGAIQILGIGTTISTVAMGLWSAAAGVATAATWLFNAALLANPVGVVIAGLALLGFGAYELVKHWSGVAAFFRTMWADVVGGFNSVVGAIVGDAVAMYNAGRHLVGELGRGIKDAAMAPVHAIAGIAASMRKYLPFSPAETGPLKDLHRVRIVETIASTMSPTPVMSAMRRVAAAAAIAVPIMVSPAMASIRPPAMKGAMSSVRPALQSVAPALASTSAPALGHVARQTTSGAPVIHNTINVTVNHRGGDDDIEGRVRVGVEAALERSGHKFAQVLKRQQQVADRLEY